jgi:hypothetical protein
MMTTTDGHMCRISHWAISFIAAFERGVSAFGTCRIWKLSYMFDLLYCHLHPNILVIQLRSSHDEK